MHSTSTMAAAGARRCAAPLRPARRCAAARARAGVRARPAAPPWRRAPARPSSCCLRSAGRAGGAGLGGRRAKGRGRAGGEAPGAQITGFLFAVGWQRAQFLFGSRADCVTASTRGRLVPRGAPQALARSPPAAPSDHTPPRPPRGRPSRLASPKPPPRPHPHGAARRRWGGRRGAGAGRPRRGPRRPRPARAARHRPGGARGVGGRDAAAVQPAGHAAAQRGHQPGVLPAATAAAAAAAAASVCSACAARASAGRTPTAAARRAGTAAAASNPQQRGARRGRSERSQQQRRHASDRSAPGSAASSRGRGWSRTPNVSGKPSPHTPQQRRG
jgi:hypothetical protein